MNRITIEQVEKAYELTGLKPKRWIYFDPKMNCGCPLAAIAFQNDLTANDILISYTHSDNHDSYEKIAEEAIHNDLRSDYHEDYLIGFMRGFDGGSNHYVQNSLHDYGFIDGNQVAMHYFYPARKPFLYSLHAQNEIN